MSIILVLGVEKTDKEAEVSQYLVTPQLMSLNIEF